MAEQADWDRVDPGSLRAEYGFRHTVADRAEKGESAACPHAVPRLTAQSLPTGVDGRERRARPPATAVASAPEGPGQCRTQVAVALRYSPRTGTSRTSGCTIRSAALINDTSIRFAAVPSRPSAHRQKRTLRWSYTAYEYRLARSQVDLYPPASGADEDSSAHP